MTRCITPCADRASRDLSAVFIEFNFAPRIAVLDPPTQNPVWRLELNTESTTDRLRIPTQLLISHNRRGRHSGESDQGLRLRHNSRFQILQIQPTLYQILAPGPGHIPDIPYQYDHPAVSAIFIRPDDLDRLRRAFADTLEKKAP